MQPTEEQIATLWRWCGFSVDGVGIYHCPDRISEIRHSPSITLNNLFKWAVPKLSSSQRLKILLAWVYEVLDGTVDPALALFWAIWKAIK